MNEGPKPLRKMPATKAALIESDSDPFFCSPYNTAGVPRAVCHEYELVRDANKIGNVELGSGVRLSLTTQENALRPNSMVPALKTRWRGALRFSMVGGANLETVFIPLNIGLNPLAQSAGSPH